MDKLLWYKKPTEEYMEGLPMGNGRLAAMALGTPEKYRLALNHEWMWRGENRDRDMDDVSEHLAEVRHAAGGRLRRGHAPCKRILWRERRRKRQEEPR